MTWPKILLLALSIISYLVERAREAKGIDDGVASALAAHLVGAKNEIDRAKAVADRVGDDLRNDPKRVRDDDGFKRQ